MGTLNIQYPIEFAILVVLTGVLFSGLLYFRDKRFSDKPALLRYSLMALRFLFISCISFFLLEPFFKSSQDEIRKPVLIIAQDASQSIRSTESPEQLSNLQAKVQHFIDQNNDSYDINLVHFGANTKAGLTDSFDMNSTDFSELFNFTQNQFQGIPVSGMIMLTDGIYNLGNNPLYMENMGFPVYPVALGDTLKKADLSIKNVFYNPIAFLGDSLSIQYDLNASELSGSSTTVHLEEIKNGAVSNLGSRNITISSNNLFKEGRFDIKMDKTGTRHFRIKADPLSREKVSNNNVRDLFIDVIDSRIKVLIVANSPHPDITALKQIIEKNKNYEVEVSMIDELNSTDNYDVLIMHDLPSSNNGGKRWFTKLNDDKIPFLLIVGSQTNMTQINDVQQILTINGYNGSQNNAFPSLNESFNAFELEENTREELAQLPPISAPYGEFNESANTKTLLQQKIGAVNTNYPLLSFRNMDGQKTAILLGEGIWRWRLNEFGRNGNQLATEDLIQKTIQYLSIKEDKRKWQVKMDKKVWNENERIQFKGILYNDNYEPVNDSEARLVIENEEGKQFDYNFTRKANHYLLDAGYLPNGEYSFTATNKTTAETLSTSGKFVIKSLQIELTDLVARHDILHQLATLTGGKVYFPDQMDQLSEEFSQKEVKTVVFTSENYMTLLNVKWIFFLILALISLEWFLRRYHGSY